MNKYNLSKKMNTFVLITAVLLLAGIVVTIIFANRAPLVKTITLIIGYLYYNWLFFIFLSFNDVCKCLHSKTFIYGLFQIV